MPAFLRPETPHLVYLDLNKWIDLAHAASGTQKGLKYEADLSTASVLVRDGKVIFPLSSAHFIEVAKIGNDSQRRTLARLMVGLSQGWFLSSPTCLLLEELRRAIASLLTRQIEPSHRASALTRNIFEVFGQPVTDGDSVRAISKLSQSPWMLEEVLATSRTGQAFVDNWKRFADQHEKGRELRSDLNRAMRKRAYCAIVTMGIQGWLDAAFAEFGLSTLEVSKELGPEGSVALLEAVPFLDVEISLHAERNEHRDRPIQPNDEIDLGFLSLAIPYCHTVVTEKFWANLAGRLKLDQRYQTSVCSELSGALAAIPTVAIQDTT